MLVRRPLSEPPRAEPSARTSVVGSVQVGVGDDAGAGFQGSHVQGSHVQGSHVQGSHVQGSHVQGSHALSRDPALTRPALAGRQAAAAEGRGLLALDAAVATQAQLRQAFGAGEAFAVGDVPEASIAPTTSTVRRLTVHTSEALSSAVAEHLVRRLWGLGEASLFVQTSAGADVLGGIVARIGRQFAPRLAGSQLAGSQAGRLSATHTNSGGSSRELAGHGGPLTSSRSARELAGDVMGRLVALPVWLIIADSCSSRFSRAFQSELFALLEEADRSQQPVAGRLVWIATEEAGSTEFEPEPGQSFVVSDALSPGELDLWWEVAANAVAPSAASLSRLDCWWRVARREVSGAHVLGVSALATLPNDSHARLLWDGLRLAARPFAESKLRDFLPAGTELESLHQAIEALAARGLILAIEPASGESEQGRVEPSWAAVVHDARVGGAQARTGEHQEALTGGNLDGENLEAAVRAAGALESSFGDDAWAIMRAAELRFLCAEIPQADLLASRAIRDVVDGDARADFWARLERAEARCGPQLVESLGKLERLLGYVELALFAGEVEIATRHARRAAASAPQDPAALLALGRCLVAAGDTKAGLAAIDRARTVGQADHARRAEIEVAAADIAYRSGDLVAAEAGANEALARGVEADASEGAAADKRSAEARLEARNVLGKVLLARGAFADAERHFTADACDASISGLFVAELRARVNRAIAALYAGRRAEAQALLEAVLEDAERRGEGPRAGLALLNLAVIATLDHRYADALSITERATRAVLRGGDRLAFARSTANLADLRLRLGLVDEAEQALRFGSRVLKGALPGEQVAHFRIMHARIDLARGATLSAHEELCRALSAVDASGVLGSEKAARALVESRGPGHEVVSQALRVGARVALEDGDTLRAELMVSRAAAERAPVRARADVAVIRAQLARAQGEPYQALATSALDEARSADDLELLREAHHLLHTSALVAKDYAGARHHLAAALSYRDRMAEGLPTTLRVAFLARRDLAPLSRDAEQFDEFIATLASSARAESNPPTATANPRAQAHQADEDPGAPSTLRAATDAASKRRAIAGCDPSMVTLARTIKKVARAEATVLVFGESGTGKELVAEALHAASSRSDAPLVKVNCAALVETLLLSELFGHEKGAFTGAAGRRRGRFEAAEGGTLFLDEIGDISHRTQVALLRVLQEKTFERVGGTTPIRANVRVICATHRDLPALVARGEFREDLYYRLAGMVLKVPALRDRLGDLEVISATLLRRIAEERGEHDKRLAPRTVTFLRQHSWPGNVRELENALRAASLFAEGSLIEPEDFADNVESLRHLGAPDLLLPDALRENDARQSDVTDNARRTTVPPPRGSGEGLKLAEGHGSLEAHRSLEGYGSLIPLPPGSSSEVAYAEVRGGTSLHDLKRAIERECIVRALGDSGGNITRAASLLGMKRPRLSQLVKQYGLSGGNAESGDTDEEGDLEES